VQGPTLLGKTCPLAAVAASSTGHATPAILLPRAILRPQQREKNHLQRPLYVLGGGQRAEIGHKHLECKAGCLTVLSCAQGVGP